MLGFHIRGRFAGNMDKQGAVGWHICNEPIYAWSTIIATHAFIDTNVPDVSNTQLWRHNCPKTNLIFLCFLDKRSCLKPRYAGLRQTQNGGLSCDLLSAFEKLNGVAHKREYQNNDCISSICLFYLSCVKVTIIHEVEMTKKRKNRFLGCFKNSERYLLSHFKIKIWRYLSIYVSMETLNNFFRISGPVSEAKNWLTKALKKNHKCLIDKSAVSVALRPT